MTTDPVLERIAWALVIAVVGLVVREAWQTWRTWHDSRTRDRLVLLALLREVAAIRGLAMGQVDNLQREAEVLKQQSRWFVQPLASLPTTAYDLVRDHPPQSILKREHALVDVMRLQAQCAYTNALTAELQKWKAPAVRASPTSSRSLPRFTRRSSNP